MSDGFGADGFLYDVETYEEVYETMLTIEDGSIVEDADSYCEIADVETYATRYGFSFSAEDLAQEQAILRAMIYIESFEDYFQGSRVSALQELSWPRAYVPNKLGTAYLASDAIPNGVKNALSEAAIAELASPGVLTATVSHSNANVKRKRDKIGPLETEVEYFGGVSLDAKTYTRILEFLRPYFRTAKSAYSVRGH
ncbi:MAG: hypothetical protein KAH44_09440 [Oricola sp.]|jgi:hypothetical protein|nr:hypothetical protein [Oricola sp.]